MSKIIISDLHLNESAKDEYMWEIFPWLYKQIDEYKVNEIKILGDLTEKKDRHPSSVVNRITKALDKLTEPTHRGGYDCDVYILKGNHDFIDEDNPFFNFVSANQKVYFDSVPDSSTGYHNEKEMYLPYTSNPDIEWKEINFKLYKTIYMHQEVEGCVYANQHVTGNGIAKDFFSKRGFKGKVYSGHIHVPQDVTDRIEYVGAPYSVRFGDHYRGRVLLINDKDNMVSYLYPDFLIKWSIEITELSDLDAYDVCVDDRVKVRVSVDRVDVHKYKDICAGIKKWCEDKGAELCGIKAKVIGEEQKNRKKRKRIDESDVDILHRFSKSEKLSDEQVGVGRGIIEEIKI